MTSRYDGLRRLPDANATELLAQALARTMPTPAVVFLHGDLGAGKSTLARAWLRALGVEGAIRSPTYTLVERYLLPARDKRDDSHISSPDAHRGEFSDASEALHLDLYRIGTGGELEFLGLDDVPAALWLVEWPERGEGGLPSPDLHIHLALGDVDGRVFALQAGTQIGREWLERLASDHELHPFAEA